MLWLIVLGGGVIAVVCFWSAVERRRLRRSGASDPWERLSGALPGLLDEVFHPQAYEGRLIQEVQRELPATAPVPAMVPWRKGRRGSPSGSPRTQGRRTPTRTRSTTDGDGP